MIFFFFDTEYTIDHFIMPKVCVRECTEFEIKPAGGFQTFGHYYLYGILGWNDDEKDVYEATWTKTWSEAMSNYYVCRLSWTTSSKLEDL